MWDGGVNGERRNKRAGNGNRNDFRIRKYAAKSCKQTEGEEGKIWKRNLKQEQTEKKEKKKRCEIRSRHLW